MPAQVVAESAQSDIVDKQQEEVVVESEETKAQNRATALLKDLTESTAPQAGQLKAAASDLAAFAKEFGLQSYGVLDSLKVAATNKKSVVARQGAQLAFSALSNAFGQSAEPYLIPVLPLILESYSDKLPVVRTAAEAAGKAVLAQPSRFAIPILLPILYDAISKSKWQSKVASLNLITSMAETSPDQIKALLVDIVPIVSSAMWDTKSDVTKAATATMFKVCAVVGNPDISGAIPEVIASITNPDKKVPEAVYALSATTFVTQVEAPALAIMTPLLERGLAQRSAVTQRQTAVIIANMCKLVEDPVAVAQFLPKLLPGLERIIEIAADPELRSVATNARTVLLRVGGNGSSDNLPATLNETPNTIEVTLKAELSRASKSANVDAATLAYVSQLVNQLIAHRSFEVVDWDACVAPYLVAFVNPASAEAVTRGLLAHYVEKDRQLRKKDVELIEDDEGEKICDCEFSLAYGGMILLNNTRLVLRRGKVYGLIGPNGAGKTTLMRAIAEGKLDGFPPADELRTVFVEHNLQASEAELSVVEFIAADSQLEGTPVDEIKRNLSGMGFSDEVQAQPVGSLSGGWKMKLELARAQMLNADILLLDEPTNHLDKDNVKWLETYLVSLPNVTSMIVSHDSGFLDTVCSNILHYEVAQLQLSHHVGNLSKFVAKRPEAKSYYELGAVTQKFKLPEPGFLDGVKSKDKALLKMQHVSFAYPGSSKTTVSDVTVQASLNSRVACIGPNGAGKSTVIKLLTGELVPNKGGQITKHPNLRVAYIAQHAFHHLEKHLDKTPNEYIRWRYQYGEDRELLASESRQISEDEANAMKKIVVYETEKRQISALVGRRKDKRSFEYEIQWVGKSYEENSWISRDQLEDWGFSKVLQAFDDKEAAKAAAWSRSLTSAEVEKHLADVGLAAEFATHSRIRGLSGGQRVKATVAASCWLNPHLLILDEPSNYLDRESLGAFAEAIKEFGGGVVIISHNQEFLSAICTETWKVDAGIVVVEGQTYKAAEKIEMKEAETKIDAFGNVEKVKSTRKLTRKEKMQRQKRRAQAKANGEEVSESEDDL